ncbi:MAG: MbnP family protein [Roseibacillus sp.]
MRKIAHHFLFPLLFLLPAQAQTTRCDLTFELELSGRSYQLGEEVDGIKVTRCDSLLSQFALQRKDGSWMEANASLVAFISHSNNRTHFSLGQIPTGDYRAIRFVVGLDSESNHSDPNRYPADHPLNPQLNNLHWTWQTGYIFCAVEGHSESDLGFLYHLGNDENATTITLPLSLSAQSARTISLRFDLSPLLGGSNLDIRATTSTHSRTGDPVAKLMSEALAKSFSVEKIHSGVFHPPTTGADLESPSASSGQPLIQSHFPKPAFPADNPLTAEGIALGKKLFFDTTLSHDRNLSCASCHQPEAAFSDTGKAFSVGHLGGKSSRNSMPLFNLAWHKEMFWDGRATTLREQVLHPIEHPDELALPLEEALTRINSDSHYQQQFETVFRIAEASSDHLAKALEQYLLSLVSQEARFDQAMRGEVEFTEQEKRGFELFVTEHDPANGLKGADCFHCHGGSLFTNHGFHNNGLSNTFKDLGRELVTGDPNDRGKLKVPSLRNLTLTAPYMHDGRFKTLEEVIEHYNSGIKRSPTLDPNLAKHPQTGLDLDDEDKADLLAFLNTLTDHKFPNSP